LWFYRKKETSRLDRSFLIYFCSIPTLLTSSSFHFFFFSWISRNSWTLLLIYSTLILSRSARYLSLVCFSIATFSSVFILLIYSSSCILAFARRQIYWVLRVTSCICCFIYYLNVFVQPYDCFRFYLSLAKGTIFIIQNSYY